MTYLVLYYIFTPFSVLINLRLCASRVVNPLPTHKGAFETRLSSDCATLSPWKRGYLVRSNPLPGAIATYCFAQRGSQRNVGAILRACIDCVHSPCTRDAIRETPMYAGEAVQVDVGYPLSDLDIGSGSSNDDGASRRTMTFAITFLRPSQHSTGTC